MKIGICFGGYCPLHKGHMDLILQSKKENDITFAFVCGYDNDRGGEILNLNKRYYLIRNFLQDDLVRVKKINDTELGIDESMSDSNWIVWLDEVAHQIFADEHMRAVCSANVTWYVGEQAYVDAINKFNPFHKDEPYIVSSVVLFDRKINPISGTMCRTNPIKYWDYIAMPFRKYYSTNVLIAGTASEGKTTLVQDIGKYFGLPYSYEKGRDNCKFKTDPEFDIEDFIYNIYEQHKQNRELIDNPQNRGVFLSDTDSMVTLMYAYFYAKRDGFNLTEDNYSALKSLATQYAKNEKWDKIFLLKPHERDIVDDGERYMKDSDYAIRCEFFEFLKSLYDEFGYQYEILDGDYLHNYNQVKSYINKKLFWYE